MTTAAELREQTVSTGVAGLDDILHGGLSPHRLYLVEGTPGSGKTTFGLQFLLEGVRNGERCLFVSLAESEEELTAAARSHGWSLDGIHILQVFPAEENLRPDARYTMFHPSEVELSTTIAGVLAEAERTRPDRVVFDSLYELRLLAEDALRYRRQILALKQWFSGRRSTVLCTDDQTGGHADRHLHSISQGVISLERRTPEHGIMRRRLQIIKMRGHGYREGFHDYRIARGGLQVFPRLVASEHHESYAREAIRSGIDALDQLLGGGLARGTSNLFLGPTGSGKSSVATQYAAWSARQGHDATIYLFDESAATFRERSAGLGFALDPVLASGRLRVRQVDPAELAPGEFAHLVRRTVEEDRTRVVVIDSLNGYLNAMPNEQYLAQHLHELLTYLGQRGVTTLLILAQHGLLAQGYGGPVDASYLADTVLLFRYFESLGRVRQAISVIKKRTGFHERTIRELRFDRGLHIGDPVTDVHGILSGSPTWLGSPREPAGGAPS